MSKKTSQELRDRAEKLLEQAKKIEADRAEKIGRLVMKYEAANFKEFEAEKFKAEIEKV